MAETPDLSLYPPVRAGVSMAYLFGLVVSICHPIEGFFRASSLNAMKSMMIEGAHNRVVRKLGQT
jgi:hypothetical protein